MLCLHVSQHVQQVSDEQGPGGVTSQQRTLNEHPVMASAEASKGLQHVKGHLQPAGCLQTPMPGSALPGSVESDGHVLHSLF